MLIGSKAAKHWFPDLPREPVDTDIISPIKSTSPKIEHHWNPAFEWLLKNEKDIASPNALYTIKVSHSFWDIWWNKTMFDIQFFQNKKCQIIEELYQLLYLEWEKKHGKKHVNLNKSNEEFFNDYVIRKTDHDNLHAWIAYGKTPYYEQLKRDKSKAWICHDLFLELPYEEQLKVCREEAYVIALERYLIPSNFRIPRLTAYRRALKDLIVRMTKGWFPKFIVEHYFDLNCLDDNNFVDKVKVKLC